MDANCGISGLGSTRRLLYQAWRRGYRRGLGLSNRTSLRETLGEPIRKAPDLLRARQLSLCEILIDSGKSANPKFFANLCTRTNVLLNFKIPDFGSLMTVDN